MHKCKVSLSKENPNSCQNVLEQHALGGNTCKVDRDSLVELRHALANTEIDIDQGIGLLYPELQLSRYGCS